MSALTLISNAEIDERAGYLIKKHGLLYRNNGTVAYDEKAIIRTADMLEKALEERDYWRKIARNREEYIKRIEPELEAYRESSILKAQGSEKIALKIAQDEGVVTPRELSNRSAIKSKSASECLNRLARRGLLVKTQRGIFKITRQGKALVT